MKFQLSAMLKFMPVALFVGSLDPCQAQTLAGALNPVLTWTTGGTAPWILSTNTTPDGGATAQSGKLDFFQSSWVETTVNGPAAVTFWWTTSSGFPDNSLELFIGGSWQAQIAGSYGLWQQRSFYVPPGPQVVQWSFGIGNTYSDGECGFLGGVSLSAPIAASIILQPTNTTINTGDVLNLIATCVGTEPLSFTWSKNGTSLVGQSSPSLRIADVQPSDAGDYTVSASNALGVATSQAATVKVAASAPVFTVQPIAQGAPAMASVTFTAAAKGIEPLTWQWYSNGFAVAGGVSTNLTINPVTAACYGDYWVVVANSQGTSTSVVARLNYSPLIAWGDNTYGQNVVPSAATNVLSVCGGDYHCLALRTDGRVLGWGNNTWAGQQYDQATVPPEATNAISVAAGSAHSLAVQSDGTVLKWGHIIYSDWQDVPWEATNVAAVALGPGAQHALALRGDGTIVECGTTNYNLLPAPVDFTNVVAVAVAAYHSLALKADGTIELWGGEPLAEYGEQVPSSATNVVAIACGWFQNLALRADGSVLAWGSGNGWDSGQTKVPPGLSNVVAIACGGNHSLALKGDGTLAVWGSYNQSSVPPWATNLVSVAGTSYGSLALIGDGPPRVSSPLVNRSAAFGAAAYFYAQAVGARPLSYQWQLNGKALAGATGAWLVVPKASAAQAGAYSVVVTNYLGATTSPVAVLSVGSEQPTRIISITLVDGQPYFLAAGQAGQIWALESSSSLEHWTPLQTLTNSAGSFGFTDVSSNRPQRFYKLRLLP